MSGPDFRGRVVGIVAGGGPATALGDSAAGADMIAIRLSKRAMRSALAEGRRRVETLEVGKLIALVPSTHAELAALAVLYKADRVAMVHSADQKLSGLRLRAARAAFALVDLTIVPDLESEKSAIRCGADPNRIARRGADILRRLVLEPPRKQRRRGAIEMAASLALDAVELSGLLRLAELAAPDRGVNVVNYHRILPLPEMASYCRPEMALAEPLFEAQLDQIAKQRGFTPIDRVRDGASEGRVAITFDDGYEDNFRVALPILQRFEAPASVFVVTSLIGRPDALWWDRIGVALFAHWLKESPGTIPPSLPPRAEQLQSATSFEEARAIISGTITDLNHASQARRQQAVEAAESLVPELLTSRTMLSWEEVVSLAHSGIAIGVHTRSHIPLDEISVDEAREEVFGSQRDLATHLDRTRVEILALPRGRLGPLSEEEMRAHGFRAVMTTSPGVNRTGEDSLYVLRRDGRMLTLHGRHHPAKLRLELTGLVDRLRALKGEASSGSGEEH